MVQLFHVSKRYGSGSPALTDLTAHVSKGEFVFLTGASGAGKSTLLKLLFGAEEPSSGQVMVAGHNVSRLGRRAKAELRRRVGVVFQDFKLLPTRSVFDNVAVTLLVRGAPPRLVRRKVDGLLRHVGLAHRAGDLPDQLSGGEQQRVAIARALAGDPLLLLADEPTGNLDREHAEAVMELLVGANARGTTVLVATHDQALLTRHPRRTVVLHSGRLIADGLADPSGVALAAP